MPQLKGQNYETSGLGLTGTPDLLLMHCITFAAL